MALSSNFDIQNTGFETSVGIVLKKLCPVDGNRVSLIGLMMVYKYTFQIQNQLYIHYLHLVYCLISNVICPMANSPKLYHYYRHVEPINI